MNSPLRFWNTLIGFVGVMTALAVIFIVKEIKSIAYVGANPTQTNTITVDGTGDAVAVPDVATFSFSVTETAKAVSDAQTAATTKANAALAAVRAAGVADSDITTESYSIEPHYTYENTPCPIVYSVGGMSQSSCPSSGNQTLTGYDVSETIQVKVRDLTKAGDIFASIGSLGVQNVDGLDFSVDKPDAIQDQARSAAIADAQSKAQELAKELGVSLVGIQSFSDNSGGGVRPVMFAMAASNGAAASAPAAPEVPAGQQKITDDVSITYEIR